MSDLTDFYSAMGSKQRDQRVKRFYTDQLGRRFFAWADKDNQRPIGEFVLADRTGRFVTPPWLPPMAYIDWPDADTLDFQWRFESLASELAGYTSEWYSHAQQLAEVAHIPIPDVGGDCHPKLIGLMGPPPLSPEIPLACAAGERWIIGRKDAPINLRLQKILSLGRSVTSTLAMEAIRERVAAMIAAQEAGESIEALKDLSDVQIPAAEPAESVDSVDPATVTYKDFISAAMRTGQSMADAALAWKAHRENLALEMAS